MKHLFFLFCSLFLVVNHSHAQNKFHLTAGTTISSFLGAEKAGPKVGISISVSKDSRLYDKFFLSTGISSDSWDAIGENRTCAPYTAESTDAFYAERHGRSGYPASSAITQNKKSSQKQIKKSKLLWSFGTNLSSFLHEEGDWQLGYSLGLAFNIPVYQRLSIVIPFSFTRIDAAPRNVEGISYANDGYIYKTFVNREISIGFLEIPILFSYKFFIAKRYDLSFLLGPAVVIAAKDFSKTVQPEDVTITDEIIGTHDFPIDPVDTRFTIPNSGLNINTGLRLHVNRFYIDVFYILYPYKIKEINQLNSIALRMGIDIH